MNVPFAPPSPTPPRAPIFTVGSALRWLGHDCPDHPCCFAPIDTLRASVWFLRGRPPGQTFPLATRVLVDATDIGDAASIRRLIHQVNGCTAHDAIEVRYGPRCADDRRFERPVPRPAPVALLNHYQPTRPVAIPDPSDDDLRILIQASRW